MNILNKIGNNLWKSNSSIYSSLIKKTSVITLSLGIFSILISSSVLDGFQFSIKEKIFFSYRDSGDQIGIKHQSNIDQKIKL